MSELIVPDMSFWISKIYNNLYMGGCFNGLALPPHIKHVVSLETDMRYDTTGLDITYQVFPMLDIREKPIYQNFMEPAEAAYQHFLTGENTLIHCQAGVNRSGLVTAATLFKIGFEPKEAINLIRQNRFPECLGNDFFERAILNLKRPDDLKYKE